MIYKENGLLSISPYHTTMRKTNSEVILLPWLALDVLHWLVKEFNLHATVPGVHLNFSTIEIIRHH
jgi:hypothetical protein